MLFGGLIGCVSLLPKYKTKLDGLRNTEQVIVYNDSCVVNYVDVDKRGNWIGSGSNEVDCNTYVDRVMICYPESSQAEIEALTKMIFEQYYGK